MEESTQTGNATASLGFYRIGLDMDYITNALGCQPTNINRKYAKGRRGAAWILESSLERTAELEQHISSLLDQVTEDLAVWRELVELYQARIFCGVFMDSWNEGFSLSPQLMKRLSDRNLPVEFDIYDPVDVIQEEQERT